MNFPTAIKTCFVKYATFKGRATRSEYWYFTLFMVIVSALLTQLFPHNGDLIASLFFLVPSIAVRCRRLHDINRSGWWQLLMFLPIIGWIILLIWLATGSKDEGNRFTEEENETKAVY